MTEPNIGIGMSLYGVPAQVDINPGYDQHWRHYMTSRADTLHGCDVGAII